MSDYFNKSDCVTAYIMAIVFNNFENGHFSMIGIEAEGTKLVFLSKVFRQQNINPLQVFLQASYSPYPNLGNVSLQLIEKKSTVLKDID